MEVQGAVVVLGDHGDDWRRVVAVDQLLRFLGGRRFVLGWFWNFQLDVAVFPELGMSPRTWRLAMLRSAPVQAVGWGHPVTTGLPSIDRSTWPRRSLETS